MSRAKGYGQTICEARRMGLAATIDMRRDANARMLAAMATENGPAYDAAKALHLAGERNARQYRSR
jgi:hypothetical protein